MVYKVQADKKRKQGGKMKKKKKQKNTKFMLWSNWTDILMFFFFLSINVCVFGKMIFYFQLFHTFSTPCLFYNFFPFILFYFYLFSGFIFFIFFVELDTGFAPGRWSEWIYIYFILFFSAWIMFNILYSYQRKYSINISNNNNTNNIKCCCCC